MLHTKAFVEKIDDNEGVITAAIGSSGIIDRDGDIIDQDGWVLDNFANNAPLLWAHNIREVRPPIGIVEKVWFEGEGKSKKLMFSPRFDLDDEFARLIYSKYKKGHLNAFSVGFIPIEKEGIRFTKQELIEISSVPVPANPDAIVQIKDLGSMEWKDFLDQNKNVVPFSGTDILLESKDWDASAALKRIKEWADGDMAKYKQAFAWYDENNQDRFTAYKLPHHDVEAGVLKTSWRGTAAAMAVLLGARGSVDLPDAEKRGVYNHLKKHYSQFEKDTPDYRMVEDQVLQKLHDEIDSYRDPKSIKFTKKHQNTNEDSLTDVLRMINKSTNIALMKLNQGGDNNG